MSGRDIFGACEAADAEVRAGPCPRGSNGRALKSAWTSHARAGRCPTWTTNSPIAASARTAGQVFAMCANVRMVPIEASEVEAIARPSRRNREQAQGLGRPYVTR